MLFFLCVILKCRTSWPIIDTVVGFLIYRCTWVNDISEVEHCDRNFVFKRKMFFLKIRR